MRLVAALLLSVALATSVTTVRAQADRMTSDAQASQASGNTPLGSANNPLVVKSVSTPKSEEELSFERFEWREKPLLDRALTNATWALAVFTGLLFLFTAALWWVTYKLSREAKRAGEAQETRMQDSIAEAVRSTAAIEKIAIATAENAKLVQGVMHRQMRAYVYAEAVGALWQDERLRYQVDINLVNCGFTPAGNVSYSIDSDIFDGDALPSSFTYPSSSGLASNDASMAPRRNFVISAVARNRLSDADAAAVMDGKKHLFCWGSVYYDDVFEDNRRTDFCVMVLFDKAVDEKGVTRINKRYSYPPKHNSAT